jgi:cell shape-determining protein MreC
MQLTQLKWIVERFPKQVQGVIVIFLLVMAGLIWALISFDRRLTASQKRIDECQSEKYKIVTDMKDSISAQQRKDNQVLQEQNQKLRDELEEIMKLKKAIQQ